MARVEARCFTRSFSIQSSAYRLTVACRSTEALGTFPRLISSCRAWASSLVVRGALHLVEPVRDRPRQRCRVRPPPPLRSQAPETTTHQDCSMRQGIRSRGRSGSHEGCIRRWPLQPSPRRVYWPRALPSRARAADLLCAGPPTGGAHSSGAVRGGAGSSNFDLDRRCEGDNREPTAERRLAW